MFEVPENATSTTIVPISTCGEMGHAATYVLDTVVGSYGLDCFKISADNVTLTSDVPVTVMGNIIATTTVPGMNGYSFTVGGKIRLAAGQVDMSGGVGANDGKMTLTGIVSLGSYSITGDVKFTNVDSNWGATTTPTGGVINILAGYSYSSAVSGTITGSDDVTITKFFFTDWSYLDAGGVINGDATFSGGSYTWNASIINGTATFNDTSWTDGGIVNGDEIFTADTFSFDPNWNSLTPSVGTVTGTVYFIPVSGTSTVKFNIGNEAGKNNNGLCGGNACTWNVTDMSNWHFGTTTQPVVGEFNVYGTDSGFDNDFAAPASSTVNFYGNSISTHTITGDVTFNDYSFNGSVVTGKATFNGPSVFENPAIAVPYNPGQVNGEAIFNGYSYNQSEINGDAIFNGPSFNYGPDFGTISGSATFTASTYEYNELSQRVDPQTGTVEGDVIFAPIATTTVTFNIEDTWTTDTSSWIFGTSTTIDPIFNFYSNAVNQSSNLNVPNNGIANFFGNAYNQNGATINGNMSISDSAVNHGIVSGTILVRYAHNNTAVFDNLDFSGGQSGGFLDVEGNSVTNLTLNNSTYDGYSAFNGTMTLNGNSTVGSSQGGPSMGGRVIANDDSTFYGSLSSETCAGAGISEPSIFNGHSGNYGSVGRVEFNENSVNGGYTTCSAVFRGSSQNTGTVGANASVYSPVHKPLGGNVVGTISYYEYPGFYFNDQVAGHGVVGDWGDPLNWWTNDSFDVHATGLPTGTDDAFIYSNVTTDSSHSAVAQAVSFFGSTQNNILISAFSGATFYGSSTNNGNINGQTTFIDDGSQNNGTVDYGVWALMSGTDYHNWSSVASNSTGDRLAATDINRYIWTYTDGDDWTLATGTRTAYAWYGIASNAAGNRLAAVQNYGSIWTYTDGGNWTAATGTSNKAWTSIASNASGDKLVAGVQGGSIWTYTDGGNWIAAPGTNGRTWLSVASNSQGDRLAAIDTNGSIWKYADGSGWTAMASTTGHVWYSITSNAAGNRLAAVDYGGSIWTYTDGGNWTAATGTSGRYWYSITSNAQGDRLAAVEIGGSVWTYVDGGHWNPAPNTSRPWYSITSNAVGDRLFAADNSNAIWSYYSKGAPINRIYTENATTTRKFAGPDAEGNRDNWLIVAQNVVVDLSNAIYSRITDIFKALGNGWFITNPNIDNGASVVPQIVVSWPLPSTATTTIRWVPRINWDTSKTCEYKMDGDQDYISINCTDVRLETDIPHPLTAGLHTLWARGTDLIGNVTEKSVTFNYDNTSPVETDCYWYLDEPTRAYYYLTNNTSNSCVINADGIVFDGRGFSVSGVNGYADQLTGKGRDFTLKNITVSHNVYSEGNATAISSNGAGDGGDVRVQNSTVLGIIYTYGTNRYDPNSAGSDGGNVEVASSTTGIIFADGGSAPGAGGNGGNVSVTYSVANSNNTAIYSRGGNSTSCGTGGDGGTVTVVDSSGYVVSNAGGASQGCSSQGGSGGSSGHSGNQVITGVYVPPTPPSPPTPPLPPTTPNTGGSIVTPFIYATTPLVIPVATVKPLVLVDLPVFGGTGKNAFSFEPLISNFLFSPLANISGNSSSFLKNTPALKSYLSKLGLSSTQDFMLLSNKGVALPIPEKVKDIPEGLIMLSTTDGTSIPLFATRELGSMPTEFATVTASSSVTVSLYPTTKLPVTITFNGKTYPMQKAIKGALLSTSITLPGPGTFTLTATGAPLPLVLKVVKPITPTSGTDKVKKQSVWGVLKFW